MSRSQLITSLSVTLLWTFGVWAQVQEAQVFSAEQAPQSMYLLGPEDQIVVHAFEAEEISEKPATIAADGSVSLPLVGTLHAGGLTIRQLEQEVTKRLSPLIVHPSVSISIAEYRSQPVSVLGEVNNAGVIRLHGDTTLLEVLSLAGGLRQDAGYSISIVRRTDRGAIPLPHAKLDSNGQFEHAEVRVNDLLHGGHPEENILIKSNDVITVPRAKLVYVVGEVNRAGGFVLNEEETMSVLQAISRAEGLKNTAAAGNARILRTMAGDSNKEEIHLDIKRILRGTAPDMALRSDDVLFVPNNVTKALAWRTVEAGINIGTGVAIWRP